MNGIDECAFEMSNGMGRSIKIAKKKISGNVKITQYKRANKQTIQASIRMGSDDYTIL